MVTTDEDALICDFAETYNIYNYKELPVLYAATLAVGLRDDTRIKMILGENKLDLKTVLMAAMVDRLSLLVWSKTKDAEQNRNRPPSVLDKLTGKEIEKAKVFANPEDFKTTRQSIIDRINGV